MLQNCHQLLLIGVPLVAVPRGAEPVAFGVLSWPKIKHNQTLQPLLLTAKCAILCVYAGLIASRSHRSVCHYSGQICRQGFIFSREEDTYQPSEFLCSAAKPQGGILVWVYLKRHCGCSGSMSTVF